MEAIQQLITFCLASGITPERALSLSTARGDILPKEVAHGDAKVIFKDAVARLPKAMETLVTMRGANAAELVMRFFCLRRSPLKFSEITTELDTTIPGMEELVELHKAGVSLSWLCFGIGWPSAAMPFVGGSMPFGLPFADYKRSAYERQNLSVFEDGWWAGNSKAKVKLLQQGIYRLLYILPRQYIFPEMPDVLETFNRTLDVINKIDIPKSADDWLSESLLLLKKHNWRSCVLFYVNQPTIVAWKVRRTKPRLVMQRYAYLVDKLFSMFGNEGLFILMRVLNEEALNAGFAGLNEVIKGASWKVGKLRNSPI